MFGKFIVEMNLHAAKTVSAQVAIVDTIWFRRFDVVREFCILQRRRREHLKIPAKRAAVVKAVLELSGVSVGG